MPGKSSDWDNAEFLVDLVVALYTGAQSNKGLTPPVKEAVEEYIKSRGYTTSFDAVRQHVQKLRKNRDTAGIQNAGTEPATPRKPKATPKRTPKKKVKSAATAEDDDDDVEDEKLKLKMEPDFMDEDMPSPSPAKRRRTATPKAEPEEGEGLAHGEV